MKVSTYSVQILATCPIKSRLQVIRDQHTPISSSLNPLIIFLAIAIMTKLMPNSYEFVSHKNKMEHICVHNNSRGWTQCGIQHMQIHHINQKFQFI